MNLAITYFNPNLQTLTLLELVIFLLKDLIRTDAYVAVKKLVICTFA